MQVLKHFAYEAHLVVAATKIDSNFKPVLVCILTIMIMTVSKIEVYKPPIIYLYIITSRSY